MIAIMYYAATAQKYKTKSPYNACVMVMENAVLTSMVQLYLALQFCLIITNTITSLIK